MAVGLAAVLAGCGGDGGPGDGRGPAPDPERDGCAPYAWYTAGDVPVRIAAAWTGGLVEDIAVQDGLAALASRSCGLRLVDVSDPAAPRLLGVGSGLPAVAVDLLDDLVAVAEGDQGFSLHDVSAPAAPVLLCRVAVSGAVGGSRYTDAVLLDGTRLFVAGFHRQLVSYDVSDPRVPVEKGRLLLDRPGALAAVGGRLFAGGRAVARVG
ncbi:MAG: hypothetical protein IH621_07300, partial [Krumholzibacteria bacterium]|nr:hypothetical protein [Candidatus Krumholzibacteria bacterium]